MYFACPSNESAVVFAWNLERLSVLAEILVFFIFALFLSDYTSWFPFLLTWTYSIIIIPVHYLHEWLTPKTFISHELECDIVVILICCGIRQFLLVLWMEINNNNNTKITKEIIYFLLLFIFVAEPWIVESWFWNATFSRITTWRSVNHMFVCPF